MYYLQMLKQYCSEKWSSQFKLVWDLYQHAIKPGSCLSGFLVLHIILVYTLCLVCNWVTHQFQWWW